VIKRNGLLGRIHSGRAFESINVAGSNLIEMLRDPRWGTIPPRNRLQASHAVSIEAPSHDLSGVSANDRVRRDIGRDHRARSDDGAIANRHAWLANRSNRR
jgi:hypothetical protein